MLLFLKPNTSVFYLFPSVLLSFATALDSVRLSKNASILTVYLNSFVKGSQTICSYQVRVQVRELPLSLPSVNRNDTNQNRNGQLFRVAVRQLKYHVSELTFSSMCICK